MLKYLSVGLALFGSVAFATNHQPLKLPETVRITSSAPRQKVWETLTPREQMLASYLLEAARAGNDLLLYQNHRHGHYIRQLLRTALSKSNIEKTKSILGPAFNELVIYAIKFEDLVGPYATSNRKYVLTKVTATQVEELMKAYSLYPLKAEKAQEVVKLLTDPNFETLLRPEDADGTGLENTGNNIYEHGITGAEVAEAIKNGLKSDVNCRIIRSANGLKCSKQAMNNGEIDPIVRSALFRTVEALLNAIKYATSEHQRLQIRHLIDFLSFGNVEDFRQMNIHWVQDGTNSKVDFMMGWVEYSTDYLTQVGSWESYVQIVDPKTTEMSKGLASHAQTFEDNMPYGEYKKKFPEGYNPPAMMVYYFQELSSFRSGGYNLPNYDDIRRDVGAKNVIRLDLPGLDADPNTIRDRRQVYEEFLLPERVQDVVDYWTQGRRTLVLMHEIIGHGSGTYNVQKYGEKEDPTTALGALGSSLEEQRADLTALVFAADPIMVEIGMFKDQAEAIRSRNAMYDAYNANFLRDTSKQQSLSEAHQRGHYLLINVLLERGVVTKVSRDGSMLTDLNGVYKINDYEKYHEVCLELLGELQHIKAEREEQSLKDLYLKYAPLEAIKNSWYQTIIQRGSTLAANAGTFEQPWAVEKGEVVVYGDLSPEGIASYLNQ